MPSLLGSKPNQVSTNGDLGTLAFQDANAVNITGGVANVSSLTNTGVTTVQAGTVSAPAITTTGDTNTGIFFPAADTIAFTEGGAEAMRIFSNGRVGIGASTDLSSGFLTVQNGAGTYTAALVNSRSFNLLPSSDIAFSGKYNTAENITVFGAISAGKENATDGNRAGYLRFFSATVSGETERMRITSAGNVGIGTSSPGTVLSVNGNVAIGATSSLFSGFLTVQNGAGTYTASLVSSLAYNASPNANLAFAFKYNAAGDYTSGGVITSIKENATDGNRASALLFLTCPSTGTETERLRIDSSGNVGIGATANASAILDVQSTTKGVRMPNMTTTQKNAISSPAAGLMVFDTTLAKLCVYSGSAWQTITSI